MVLFLQALMLTVYKKYKLNAFALFYVYRAIKISSYKHKRFKTAFCIELKILRSELPKYFFNKISSSRTIEARNLRNREYWFDVADRHFLDPVSHILLYSYFTISTWNILYIYCQRWKETETSNPWRGFIPLASSKFWYMNYWLMLFYVYFLYIF